MGSDKKHLGKQVTDYLDSIQIVLVNTTLPANIGSAARAMNTMGLKHLTVVDPKHPIDDTSISHAAGGLSILQQASVVDTLQTAIQDCHLVFAASSRTRTLPRPVVNPTAAATLIAQFVDKLPSNEYNYPQHTHPKIAVLFGREDRGLTNDELALADYHIQIDANPAYPVLNVAAAVQVIASFFYAYFLKHTIPSEAGSHRLISEQNTIELSLRQTWDEMPASHADSQKLQDQLLKLMHTLELIDSDDPNELRDLPSRFSRLNSRLQLDEKECEIFTAIVAKLNRRLIK